MSETQPPRTRLTPEPRVHEDVRQGALIENPGDTATDRAVNELYRTRPHLSARDRFTRGQWIWLSFTAVFLVISGLIDLRLPFFIITLAYTAHSVVLLTLRLWLLALSLKDAPCPVNDAPPLPDAALPVITVLCPLYREAESLPNLVRSLNALDYPQDRLDIRLLLEADDHETWAAAEACAAEPPFTLLKVPPSEPRTKPKAMNVALWTAPGSLIVVYDAEDRPEADQLRKAASAFAVVPEDVACLQAQLNYYNRRENWLTRLFAMEYAFLFDLMLPGLARLDAPLPLGGTSNIFRTKSLKAVGGWDPYNVTEDADLGLRMAAAGMKSRPFAPRPMRRR